MIAQLYIFTIICYAITSIALNSRLFKYLKSFTRNGTLANKFLQCPLCIGFHVGYIVLLLSNICSMTLLIFGTGIVSYFFAACYSSGMTYLLYVIVDDDGIRIS